MLEVFNITRWNISFPTSSGSEQKALYCLILVTLFLFNKCLQHHILAFPIINKKFAIQIYHSTCSNKVHVILRNTQNLNTPIMETAFDEQNYFLKQTRAIKFVFLGTTSMHLSNLSSTVWNLTNLWTRWQNITKSKHLTSV